MTGNLKPLDQLEDAEQAVVHSINAGLGLASRLSAMGLHPGVSVRVMCVQPARGPIVVEVGRSMRLALGRGMARKVLVEVKGGGK